MRAEALTRSQIAVLHLKHRECPFAANRFLAVISKCYAWGSSRGLLPEGHINPARGIERYKEHSRERYLTGEELARLGEALVQCETRFGPFAVSAIRLLALSGMRLGEVLSLRWEQIDFERGIATLPDSKTGRKPVLFECPCACRPSRAAAL
jgi:integrase